MRSVSRRQTTLLFARLPFSGLRVILEQIQGLCIARPVTAAFMDDFQVRLAVVAHELEIELQLQCCIQVAAAEVEDEGLGAGDASARLASDGFEERHGRAVNVDAGDCQVVAVFALGFCFDDEAAAEDEGRDGDVELFHHAGHQVV